jgi:integrase
MFPRRLNFLNRATALGTNHQPSSHPKSKVARMAITRVTSKKKRSGWTYDSKEKLWYSYLIDVRVGGERIRERGFKTREKAEEAISELREKAKRERLGLKTGKVRLITVRELLDRRLKDLEGTKEYTRASRIFKYFLNLIPDDLKVTELKRAHLKSFNTARRADGVKNETITREMNPLASALHDAGEMFSELEDWVCPPVPREQVSRKGRERVVTEKEKNLICKDLLREPLEGETRAEAENRHRIARMFELAWLLGLRLGECLKLLKSDYRAEERTLRVVRWKTGETTVFEFLPDEALRVLDDASRASGSEYIFTLTGSYPKDFYKILRAACERNDIIYGRDRADGLTFHSNRHSFTTRLIQVTDPATAKSFTAHSREEMVLYYSHASKESRRAAMEKLYGERGNGKITQEKAREVFEKIRENKMKFAEFYELIFNSKNTL